MWPNSPVPFSIEIHCWSLDLSRESQYLLTGAIQNHETQAIKRSDKTKREQREEGTKKIDKDRKKRKKEVEERKWKERSGQADS
jgi:hypothetical protein